MMLTCGGTVGSSGTYVGRIWDELCCTGKVWLCVDL